MHHARAFSPSNSQAWPPTGTNQGVGGIVHVGAEGSARAVVQKLHSQEGSEQQQSESSCCACTGKRQAVQRCPASHPELNLLKDGRNVIHVGGDAQEAQLRSDVGEAGR